MLLYFNITRFVFYNSGQVFYCNGQDERKIIENGRRNKSVPFVFLLYLVRFYFIYFYFFVDLNSNYSNKEKKKEFLKIRKRILIKST